MNIRYNWCKSGRAKGAFSLIELLVVIAIFSILVGLSVPSIHHLLQRYEFLQRYNRLQQMLYYTKAMAILKKRRIMLCGSGDGQHCDGDWNRYWLLREQGSWQLLKRIELAPIGRFHITWQGNFKEREGIYFNALGETGGHQGRFKLRFGTNYREIILTLSGRMR